MILADQVAIVTGASRGLGKAIALALAGAGADIAVLARTDSEGGPIPGTIHQTAEAIRQLGRRALPIRCDVSNDENVADAAKQVLETFGRVDILVTNAASLFRGPFIETSVRRFDTGWRVNTRAFFVVVQAFLPTMVAQKRGHILSIAPPASVELASGALANGVTKQAITLLAQGLAKELAEHNIAVNCLWPEGQRASEVMLYTWPDTDKSGWLNPQVMGDAALAVVQEEPASFTGNALTDQEMLRREGLTDFAKYRFVQ